MRLDTFLGMELNHFTECIQLSEWPQWALLIGCSNVLLQGSIRTALYTYDHTIDTLCTIFATHGLPELLALDNGSSFSSTEFKELMEQKWNLPYHITRVIPSFQWPGWVSCADIDVQRWAQECKWWGSTNTPSRVPFTLESPHLDLNGILLMRYEWDNVNSYMFPISQVEQSGYLEYLYSQVKFLRVFGSPSTPLYIVSIKFKAVGSGAAGASRTTSFQGADFFTIYFLV